MSGLAAWIYGGMIQRQRLGLELARLGLIWSSELVFTSPWLIRPILINWLVFLLGLAIVSKQRDT